MENLTMHRQWASRPADERFETLAQMYAMLATETRQCGTAVLDTASLRAVANVDGTPGSLALVGPAGAPAHMTHWSLSQLAGIAKAPSRYIQSLPAEIAADCLNYGLTQQPRESHQLFLRRTASNGSELAQTGTLAGQDAPGRANGYIDEQQACRHCQHRRSQHKRAANGALACSSFGCGCSNFEPLDSPAAGSGTDSSAGNGNGLMVRAVTSPGYTRIHTAAIVRRLQELTDQQPSWKAPEVYARGDFGGSKRPCVGFAGDRDAYIMLVNDSVRIADPTSGEGLMRGLMIQNSEVGARRLDLTCFLCRYVCGNMIVWGYKQIASLSMRHYGEAIRRSWSSGIARTFADYATLSAHDETDKIQTAARKELGPTKDDVIDLLFKRFDIGKQQASDAYALAERYESNPRSAWGAVQGLSRLSQLTPYADERIDLDRAAARILDF